ncbi:hypothetical protein VB774_23365 [Pseudanabaena galeata UHCC 0370]|uniref:Uncharacterized protein n=1 Tax=Pseudanabaena galeata UHCC 0370 TaxID=3110310 RepID=A0ABU5TQL0_9CYAN|nr:hypothetical protein [Pseudanabaena galeata]MEA5480586.1 hypothetical protein [Pseudanabaena galeata UHCC 0370]
MSKQKSPTSMFGSEKLWTTFSECIPQQRPIIIKRSPRNHDSR